MIQQYITDLVGSVPSGLEDAVYVLSILVLFFLLAEIFAFLHMIFHAISNM